MAKKEITYKFGANTADVDKKLAQMSSKMKDLGKSMQNIGKSMSLYVTAPIMALGAGMAKAAMDLEASDAKFQTVFKGMTNEATAFIKEFRKLTPATTAEARNMASGIQDLLIPMGFMRKEATSITGELMHVSGALANFNSGTHTAEDVVRAMQSALTGMYRPLKSLGVQLDETTIKQKAVEYGLAGVGEEISKQVKVQVMLKEVYAQSGDALNAYTKENLDAKTSMGLLRADLSELGVQFGNILLPIINKMIARIRGWIEVFSKLEPQTKKIIMVVMGLAAAIGPLLIALGVIVKTIIPALIAGGAALQAAWLPVTLVILGVAAAIAIFTRNSREAKKAINELSQKSFEELNKELIEAEANLKKLNDEALEKAGGVGRAMYSTKEMKEARAQVIRLREAIAKKNEIESEAKQTAEAYRSEIDKITMSMGEQSTAVEKNLGVLGKLEQRLTELNAQKLTVLTPEELKEIYNEIKNVNDAIDDFYMSMRSGSGMSAISTQGAGLASVFEIDHEKIKENLRALVNNFREASEEINGIVIDLGKELSYLATDVLVSLAESMGNAFNGGTFKEGLNDLLITVANWAQDFGGMLIAAGIASEAFQKSLALAPGLAIGAGIALIAAATAVKGALSQNPMGGNGGGGGGGGSQGSDIFGMRDLGQFSVAVTGTLRADGNELITVIENENRRTSL